MDPIVGTRVEAEPAIVEKTVRSTEVLPTIPEDTSTPPSLRLEQKQLPLIVDLLGAKPFYDTFNVKELSELVDAYINGEISRRSLESTEEVYKSVVEEITRKLNLSEDTTAWSKLEKIAEYSRIENKIRDAVKEREKLLKTDPENLTVDQLKTRMDLNV